MTRDRHPVRNLAFTFAVTALVGGLILGSGNPAFTDDTELLRKGAADPYIFILMDTSGSMNLGLGDTWVPGGGDNPSSRLYLAKRALYEVFSPVSNVFYGFAGFNQDGLYARSKHWLYYNDTALPASSSWPLDFPKADTDGLTDLIDTNTIDTNGDGVADASDGIPETRISKIDGDVLTFGPQFPVGTNITTVGTAASCGSPLDLDTTKGRRQAQSFALEVLSAASSPSKMWVASGNSRYLLTIVKQAANNVTVYGQDRLKVTLTLQEYDRKCDNTTTGTAKTLDLTLRADPYINDYFVVDSTVTGNGNNAPETLAGLWDWTDVVDSADFSQDHPFTGMGWEGNYDSNHDGSLNSISGATNADRYCNGANCTTLKPIIQTSISSVARVLDRGDVLPLDWNDNNRTDFLDRLSPTAGDYGMATYFTNAAAASGILLPRNNNVVPLIAEGKSPLNKAIVDFRCFYLGKEGNNNNKCPDTAFYQEGWDSVACKKDLSYGCRRPYLIVISDGEENANGESPTADVASMNSHAGVQTWVLNLGDAGNCKGNGSLNSLTQAGKGQCITVTDPTQLKTELQNILGVIEQRSRSFASGAVPSVQVSVANQKVFITNFSPIKSSAWWDGHARSFVKPIVDANGDGKPDIIPCTSTRITGCHLWDAGAATYTQAPDAAAVAASPPNLQLGVGQNQRRVVYARLPNPSDATLDTWPETMRLFNVTTSASGNPIRYDLWRAMGIIPLDVADGSLSSSDESDNELLANAVIKKTLVKKSAVLDDSSTANYVLGDIFHSNPVIVGSPTNVRFFADNVAGYRDFATKNQNRRKMLMFGSNEGMMHAFDAGRYFTSGTDAITGVTLTKEFDNGTGKELFAFVPRSVMPRMRQMFTSNNHQFTVDGSLSVADVYIDPKVDLGVPLAADRLWRTVAIGGLREGGSGYYAVDVTQPDILKLVAGDWVPDYRDGYVPSCMTNYSVADCGPVPFPSVLWEFNDTVLNSLSQPVALDEDGNGLPDLGATWSLPNIGRIRLCTDAACATTIDKDVAIFGGGMDADHKSDPLDTDTRGNWLYIVDIETGNTIYKRKLEGSAPSEPSAVDTNQDGLLDRIYIGTLAGRMYRVDLTADKVTNKYPVLTNTTVKDKDGISYTVQRIPVGTWDPRVIFNANYDGSTALAAPSLSRGIYFRPSVLFVAKLSLYALAFGTGDREDLWTTYGTTYPRFYIFIDDTDKLPVASLPITESNFQAIDITSTTSTTADYLLGASLADGHRGWFLRFNDNDRLITDPFSLSGITIFSTYVPKVTVSDSGGGGTVTIACGTKGTSSDTNNTCAKRGNSRNFVMNTTNGNTFLLSATGTPARYQELDFFVTNPYAEQAQSRNATPTGPSGIALTVNQQKVMDSLKSLFPSNCKFGNYRIDIMTITDETQIERIAAIPVCVIEKNWKEF
jgi:hypothetical protein